MSKTKQQLKCLFEITESKQDGKRSIVFRSKKAVLDHFRMETIVEYLKDIKLERYDDMRNWMKCHSNASDEIISKITNKELEYLWYQSILSVKNLSYSDLERIFSRDKNIILTDDIFKDNQVMTLSFDAIEPDLKYYTLAKSIIDSNAQCDNLKVAVN